MKKNTLTLILWLCCIVVYSQPYESILGQESTVFNLYFSIGDGGLTSLNYLSDTVEIEQVEYLEFSDENSEPYYIRITSDNSQVFEYINGREYLTMDLNLEKADTFYFTQYGGSLIDTLIVDSVFYRNERKHIALNSYTNSIVDEKLTFIEGVGTNFGLFYQFEMREDWYLLCAYKDDIQTYANYSEFFKDTCNYTWVDINEKSINDTDLSIFPNPSSGIFNLTLKTNSESIYQCIILDFTGKMIMSRDLSENELQIDLSDYSSGIYMVMVKDHRNKIFTRKIVKK